MGTIKLMKPVAAAKMLGVAEKTLRNWRSQGIGPRYFRISRKMIRYSELDIKRFMEGMKNGKSNNGRRENNPVVEVRQDGD